MGPEFLLNGCLVPGIHRLTMQQISEIFGYTSHRRELISGFAQGVSYLKQCGCRRVFLDGSFVTRKHAPVDFDACWDMAGVDLAMLYELYPIFFDFANGRANQKRLFKGEFFPANSPAIAFPVVTYLQFFQKDRNNDDKGIVELI